MSVSGGAAPATVLETQIAYPELSEFSLKRVQIQTEPAASAGAFL